MADIPLSGLTELTSLSDTDLFAVSEDLGGGSYESKYVTKSTLYADIESSNNYAFAYRTNSQEAGSVRSTGTVTLTGGASGSVNGITVNGVQIMSGSVAYTTSLSETAQLVAANIAAFNSTPNYSASSNGAIITIYARTTGTGPNGFTVTPSTTTITTSSSNMAGGTAATTNTFSNVFFEVSTLNGWVHNPFTPVFKCNLESLYSCTIEFNAEKSGGGSPQCSMVVTKNGTQIAGSHQGIDITSNNTTFSLSRTFLFSAVAGDEIRARFAASTTNVSIVAAPDPTGTVTAVSAAITIRRLT